MFIVGGCIIVDLRIIQLLNRLNYILDKLNKVTIRFSQQVPKKISAVLEIMTRRRLIFKKRHVIGGVNFAQKYMSVWIFHFLGVMKISKTIHKKDGKEEIYKKCCECKGLILSSGHIYNHLIRKDPLDGYLRKIAWKIKMRMDMNGNVTNLGVKETVAYLIKCIKDKRKIKKWSKQSFFICDPKLLFKHRYFFCIFRCSIHRKRIITLTFLRFS